MVVSESRPETKEQVLVLTPNRSLTWRQTQYFLAASSVALVLVATIFAVKGYWLILPFAGLELLVLVYCSYLVVLATYRCEVIRIGEHSVTVERGYLRNTARRGPEYAKSFQKSWVRVEWIDAEKGERSDHLMLGASGSRIELGAFLTETEKREVQSWLKNWL